MEQTSRQRNQCNPDRPDRKPLLRRLVNRKSHLRRNRRCRPSYQGIEKERREGNPIPTDPLTHPTLVSTRSQPFGSSPPEIRPPVRKYRELVEPSCSRPKLERVCNGQSPFEPFCIRRAIRKSCNFFEANGIFLKPSGHHGQRKSRPRKGRGAKGTRKAVMNPSSQ